MSILSSKLNLLNQTFPSTFLHPRPLYPLMTLYSGKCPLIPRSAPVYRLSFRPSPYISTVDMSFLPSQPCPLNPKFLRNLLLRTPFDLLMTLYLGNCPLILRSVPIFRFWGLKQFPLHSRLYTGLGMSFFLPHPHPPIPKLIKKLGAPNFRIII